MVDADVIQIGLALLIGGPSVTRLGGLGVTVIDMEVGQAHSNRPI